MGFLLMFCAPAIEAPSAREMPTMKTRICSSCVSKPLRCDRSGLSGARQPGYLGPRLLHLGERGKLGFGDARENHSGLLQVFLVAQRLEKLRGALHEARRDARGLAVEAALG